MVVQSRSEPADKTPGSYRRPTRVFRIQGRKRAVQAAAEIIQEAVQRCASPPAEPHRTATPALACNRSSSSVPLCSYRLLARPCRYRELNESKMRGEFVQRQQIIRGVEFSYQPPPRANNVPGGQARPRRYPILRPLAFASGYLAMGLRFCALNRVCCVRVVRGKSLSHPDKTLSTDVPRHHWHRGRARCATIRTVAAPATTSFALRTRAVRPTQTL